MQYDYIIAGGGGAGLSLLYRILHQETLREKQILVIDQDLKNKNDRTWCFWEEGEGLFEPVVRHQWPTLEFKTEQFVNKFALQKYRYKMIRGLDFYNYVLDVATKSERVTFKHEKILHLSSQNDQAKVITDSGQYEAAYVFNSTSLLNPKINTDNSLLQHFMGWEIKTSKPMFDDQVGTLMDFSLNQDHGATFMYVLPVNSQQALIEYTLFSPVVLDKDTYRNQLATYINGVLGISEYNIVDDEFGVIPMSLQKFRPSLGKHIINIGTAGGHTKASSGYTFQFIQKNTQSIVQNLVAEKSPLVKPSFREKMFQWYDRTLLEVMISQKMTGKAIFATMFKKLAPEKILTFLDNETNFLQDLSVMSSVPTVKFLPSALKQMFR
ncbi:MAG TPA: lycopene cyclase [Microscillaceae bacterium]|nr:lycopene cyclase [Microscillaceae bacterium]